MWWTSGAESPMTEPLVPEQPGPTGEAVGAAAGPLGMQFTEVTNEVVGVIPDPPGLEARRSLVVTVSVATQTKAPLDRAGAAPATPARAAVRIPPRVTITMHGGCYHLDGCPFIRNRQGLRTYNFCTSCGWYALLDEQRRRESPG